MDAFFCKLASSVRLNFGSGLSPRACRQARARASAPAVSHSLTPLLGKAEIHTDVRSSYRPKLLLRLYELEACDACRLVREVTSICA